MRISLICFILSPLFFMSCIKFKSTGLYQEELGTKNNDVRGLNAASIYDGRYCGEIWYTQSTSCITVQQHTENQREQLSIRWNKPGGGCDWVGMGIGWNGWSGKDFSQCIDSAALSFSIKSNQGEMKNLPWAVGFEDFNGGQAWTGFNNAMIQGGVIGDQWTQVNVPLYAFPFIQRAVDVTSIKQIIFQFETSGEVLMDHIKIVPYHLPRNKTYRLRGDHAAVLGSHELSLQFDNDSLHIQAHINDATPFQQNKTGKDIWNGDALEIAFSTDATVSASRPFLYESDRHIGISLARKPEIWDWSRNKKLSGKLSVQEQTGIVHVQCSISWKELGVQPWTGGNYGFEWAIDEAGNTQSRVNQKRWNSFMQEGFHENPALWGKINIENIQLEIK